MSVIVECQKFGIRGFPLQLGKSTVMAKSSSSCILLTTKLRFGVNLDWIARRCRSVSVMMSMYVYGASIFYRHDTRKHEKAKHVVSRRFL